MKYRLLSFASIIVGLLLSLFLIRGDTQSAASLGALNAGGQAFPVLSSLAVRAISILTTVLLLSGLCISCNRLLRLQKLGKTVRYFFSTALIGYLVAQILAFLVIKIPFLPGNDIPDISQIHKSLSTFGLNANIWNRIQNIRGLTDWASMLSRLNNSHYLVWLALAGALGCIMLRDNEASEPTYNLLDSISRLVFPLLQGLFSLLSIYLIAYIAYTLWQIRSDSLLIFYLGFFVDLIVIIAVLFLSGCLLLFFVYKDKKPHLFLCQSFLSIFSSFLTGNAMFSMGTLIVEQKNRLGISRDVGGLLNPLNLLFLRPGSAIVLAVSFITYYSSNTRWQLSFFSQLYWLILIPIILAIAIGLFSIPSHAMLLPFYLVMFGLGTTDTFVIMAPILLLGQSFANCIDVFSWSLSNYIYDRFYYGDL